MNRILTTGIAAAMLASGAIATPALAKDEPESIAVKYTDLNLATEEGQATLHRRLMRAAEQVCDFDRRSRAFALPTSEARRCLAEATKDFDRKIAAAANGDKRGTLARADR